MDSLKQSVLHVFEKSLGNISHTCTKSGISRQTFYNWIDTDAEFAAAIDNAKEAAIDMVETALFKQIQEGNTACIIFYLKTKAKHRGYIERQELTGKDGAEIVVHQYTLPDGSVLNM